MSVDLNQPRERHPGVEYRIADVRNLRDFDSGAGISRIYNLAAVHTTPGHPTHEYYETNVTGALEITRFAERHDVTEIVFTSSISVYGPGEETKTEASPLRPASAYGYSKLLAEGVHKQWLEREPGRKLTVVRPAVVFGPGEGGNFTRLAKLLSKGFFIYPGRKDTIKACIYVADLLDAISFARSQPDDFILFNGAYPQRYTLEQIVEALSQHYFPQTRTVMVPRRVVVGAAAILKMMNFLNIGIHPERVIKLVRSTDVVPAWLQAKGFTFPEKLEPVFARWAEGSAGTFQ